MELLLQRGEATRKSTPGDLTGINASTFPCLEPPPVPDPDEPGCPICIPAGRYRVRTQMSGRWQTRVPVLDGVPGRTAIEIHPGSFVYDLNKHVFDSEGCVLAGMWRQDADMIIGTQEACQHHIWPAICEAEDRGEDIFIEVRDAA